MRTAAPWRGQTCVSLCSPLLVNAARASLLQWGEQRRTAQYSLPPLGERAQVQHRVAGEPPLAFRAQDIVGYVARGAQGTLGFHLAESLHVGEIVRRSRAHVGLHSRVDHARGE